MTATILLDLDGVLVDFLGGICRAHGREGYVPATWDFFQEWGMAEHDFWEPADDPDWWANLEWTAEGRAILARCEDAVGAENVYILTSGRAAPAAAGKTRWVKRELGRDYLDRLLIGHSKGLLAAPGRVLVDDAEHNVDAFRAAGGRAVLVPRPWNRLWAGGGGEVDYVATQLQCELAALPADPARTIANIQDRIAFADHGRACLSLPAAFNTCLSSILHHDVPWLIAEFRRLSLERRQAEQMQVLDEMAREAAAAGLYDRVPRDG